MSLQFMLEKLDGVDSAIAALYEKQSDGKFQLKIEGLPEPKDPSAELTTALQTERANVAQAKRDLKDWKALGENPAAVKTAMDDLKTEAAEASKGNKSKEDYDAMLAQATDAHKAEMAKVTGERDAAIGGERKAVIDSGLKSAFMEAGFNDEGLMLLPDRYANRVEIEVGEDGKRTVKILSEDGKSPLVGSGENHHATFADLAKEAAGKFKGLLDADRIGGGGSDKNKNSGGSKTISRSDFDALGEHEKGQKMADGFTIGD